MILLKLLVMDNNVDGSDGKSCKSKDLSNLNEDFSETNSAFMKKDEKSSIILDLLQNYSQYIDLEQALRVLPDHISLNMLKNFLHSSLSQALSSHHRKQIKRGLTKSMLLKTQEVCITEKKGHVTLSETSTCCKCNKRFTKHRCVF